MGSCLGRVAERPRCEHEGSVDRALPPRRSQSAQRHSTSAGAELAGRRLQLLEAVVQDDSSAAWKCADSYMGIESPRNGLFTDPAL